MKSRNKSVKKLIVIPVALTCILLIFFISQQVKNYIADNNQNENLQQNKASFEIGVPFVITGEDSVSQDKMPTIYQSLGYTGSLEYTITDFNIYSDIPNVAGLNEYLSQFDLSVFGYNDPVIASVSYTIKNIDAQSKDYVIQENGTNALNVNYNLSSTTKDTHPETLYVVGPQITSTVGEQSQGYVWPETGSTIELTNYYVIDKSISDSYVLDLAPAGTYEGSLQIPLGTPNEADI